MGGNGRGDSSCHKCQLFDLACAPLLGTRLETKCNFISLMVLLKSDLELVWTQRLGPGFSSRTPAQPQTRHSYTFSPLKAGSKIQHVGGFGYGETSLVVLSANGNQSTGPTAL